MTKLLIVRTPFGHSENEVSGLEKALTDVCDLMGDIVFLIMREQAVERVEFEYPKNSDMTDDERKKINDLF